MNRLARIVAIATRSGDDLYPTAPSQRLADISERERLMNRARAVIRRDRINHQHLQTQTTYPESRT